MQNISQSLGEVIPAIITTNIGWYCPDRPVGCGKWNQFAYTHCSRCNFDRLAAIFGQESEVQR